MDLGGGGAKRGAVYLGGLEEEERVGGADFGDVLGVELVSADDHLVAARRLPAPSQVPLLRDRHELHLARILVLAPQRKRLTSPGSPPWSVSQAMRDFAQAYVGWGGGEEAYILLLGVDERSFEAGGDERFEWHGRLAHEMHLSVSPVPHLRHVMSMSWRERGLGAFHSQASLGRDPVVVVGSSCGTSTRRTVLEMSPAPILSRCSTNASHTGSVVIAAIA